MPEPKPSDDVALRESDLAFVVRQLQPVIVALREALGEELVAIVLFGSRARGDARPDSDWDLLLIAENLPASPWRRNQRLQGWLPPDWRGHVNLLARTPAEWYNGVSSLALDIALDGIVLYERPHSRFSARLVALQEQLASLGLMRHPLGGGEWIWLWRDQPPQRWELEWMK